MESGPNDGHAEHAERRVRLVAVHSFRGGTGKSNLSANMAYLAARAGARVAVLDTDLQSPGVHALFGLQPDQILRSLSDFVQKRCEIGEVAIDLTREMEIEEQGGKLFLLPSSLKLEAITRILSEGYETDRLNRSMLSLAADLELDYLVLDTHPGLNRETLLCIAIADTMVVVLRPDHQDYQGTAVLVQIASKIGVPELVFVANKVADGLQAEDVGKKVEEAFGFPVVGVLPISEEFLRLGSGGVFAAQFPRHPLVKELERMSERILPLPTGETGERGHTGAGARTAGGGSP